MAQSKEKEVKIITKEITWKETANPHVDALMCPFCEESGIVLDPTVVLADGPVEHVNLGKVRGKLLTLQGKCAHCGNKFLWRMMFMPQGTYSWLDVAITAGKFNELLAAHSTAQLPCMCEDCVNQGKITTAPDEICAAPANIPVTLTHAPCPSKQVYPVKSGAPPKIPLSPTILKPVEIKTPADLEEALNQVAAPLLSKEGKIRQLTDAQVALVAKEMKTNFKAVAAASDLTEEEAKKYFTELIEAYVRIKFAVFQPSPNPKPNLPPSFPTIVPTKVYEAFNAQKDISNFCQYVISKFYLVDHALQRQDLAASVMWNHMCCMCPVKTCTFHPTNRNEA